MEVPKPQPPSEPTFDVGLITEEEMQLAVFRIIYTVTPPNGGRTLNDIIHDTEVVVDYILSGKIPDADLRKGEIRG